jgi:2-polyprenyl-3-methyl-5-hydroxy-6-metoxy-1,4-benzoquinol methylase
MNIFRKFLRSGYYLVRGGGQPHLLKKKEYHRRRQISERKILEEAKTNPSMFRDNSCPACGSTAGESFVSPVGFSFQQCPADGMVYMSPVPTELTLARLYNEESYSFHWNEDKETTAVKVKPEGGYEFDNICKNLQFPAERRLRLLDVGCATGGFLLTAKGKFDVKGVELADDLAVVARKEGLDVVTGTLGDLPASDLFDVITMRQLIEHVANPTEILKQAFDHLNTGGIVYANTPNVDSASFRLFRERHMHVSSFGHVSLFTPQSLKKIAERCGFTTVVQSCDGPIDIELHDLLTYKLANGRFIHRMALYNQRLFAASTMLDIGTGGLLRRAMTPAGATSYQWAIFRKP